MSIRVPENGTVPVPENGTVSKTKRYARIPVSVLHDTKLSASARLVYAEMALWVFQGTVCSIGVRKIAQNLGLSKTTVVKSIGGLISAGLVDVKKSSDPGKRSVYLLLSKVFGQKQGKVTEVVSSPSCGRRFASVSVEEVA